MYEIIDSLPIVILAPLFDSQWGLVVGLLNGFLRLGSVMNFVLSPVIYKTRGVKVALWFATAIATSAVLFAALAYSLTRKKEMLDGKKYEQLDGSNHIELNVLCPEQDEEGEGDWLGDTEGERNVLHKDHTDEVLHDTHIMSRNTTTPVPVKIVNSTLAVPSVTSPIGIASGPMISSSAHLTRSDEENPSDRFSAVSMDKNVIVLSTGTVRGRILSALPLHLFGYQFYMFLCTGACLYGSMVPFWFLGSKFLQDCYSLTVGQADGLMLLPEGMIALVSVPIGMLLDSYNCATKLRLQLLAASCLLLPLSYSMLALGYRISIQEDAADSQVRSSSQTLISPYLTMFCIGTAYAVSNSLYWSTIMDVLPKGRYFSSANGLIASCLNILPSVVPTILVLAASVLSTQEDILRSLPMFVLSFIGICAAGFSFLASLGTKISSIQSDD